MKGTPVELPLAHAVPLSRYLLFFSIAGLGCGMDLWTKHAVFQWRGMPKPGNEWWLWEGYVGIETALNHGALFGMGQGLTWVFAVLSVLAVAGIVYWLFFAGAARDLVLTISLAAVTAGILGNLYDRLGLWGGQTADGQTIYAVRDWILFRYGRHTWPNFNLADSLLVCGAGTLILHAWKCPGQPTSGERTPEHHGASVKN